MGAAALGNPVRELEPVSAFAPAEFRDAAIARVHDACRALQALGAKPCKPAIRDIVKDLVLWFNDADGRTGGVIETEKREAICLAIEEIVYVAGHLSLLDEIGAWRDW